MTADQEDDSIPLSYAEAEGSGRVVCCGPGVSLWHKADLTRPSARCPLLGVTPTSQERPQRANRAGRARGVPIPGFLMEEIKPGQQTQAQEPMAPRHSPRSRPSHLTRNTQADAAARLDVALRAAKKC